MAPHTIQDIVGDGAAHALATAGVQARTVIIAAVSGSIRVGDGNVAANRGVAVAAGTVPLVIQADPADKTALLDLSLVSVYVPLSSTATITYLK